MPVKRFRFRPAEVEAMRFPGVRIDTIGEVLALEGWLMRKGMDHRFRYRGSSAVISELYGGEVVIKEGEWIAVGSDGVIRVFGGQAFGALYEEIA